MSFIDLSPLSEVAEVHGHFLSGCAGLSGLDLSPLSQLTKVPWHFLEGCAGLTSLDLSALSQVTEVQGDFLGGCIGLASLDLSPLSQVIEVQEGFLEGCTQLTSITSIPPPTWMVIEGGCQSLDLGVEPRCIYMPGRRANESRSRTTPSRPGRCPCSSNRSTSAPCILRE